MTKLSVNVNKIALLRNARGQNQPDLLAFSRQCLDLGAQGITAHPRPDQRHIRYDDLSLLSGLLQGVASAEFNIEGYPSETFIEAVLHARPDQVTLVPDPPEALTSSFGWRLPEQMDLLIPVIRRFKAAGIRVSIFVDPDMDLIAYLPLLETDRVELYTYDYVHQYEAGPESAIAPFKSFAKAVSELGIGMNAGHDLNLDNLRYLVTEIPQIQEVSIGHALVGDALQLGLPATIEAYLACLK
ncbi:MAG: pyridoxine 5'-phosphate synthase [Actinobacteria bacterium]|nr:pyridoxine 5'-phosphate synthase [Actinomycetota bacterium]